MNITGTCHMNAPVQVAWDAFHDQGVLERTIPGVKRLNKTGEDAYTLAVTMGVASIKGTYEGDVALTDQVAPSSFVLVANGAGAPGTIGTKVAVRLAEAADGGTDIAYDADAIVGGPVGGVGQRMLSGVAKRVATQFFAAIDRDIACGGTGSAEDGDASAGSAGAGDAAGAGGQDGAASGGSNAPAASADGASGVGPGLARLGGVASTSSTASSSLPGQVPFWVVLAGVGTGAACTLAGVTLGWVAARGGRR